MSGSSLDGLDIAYCRFEWNGTQVLSWDIEASTTVAFPDNWIDRLKAAPESRGLELMETHVHLGHWMGDQVHTFTQDLALRPDFVASHGHTVFHEPSKGFTCQIGDGAAIAAETNLPVICDFRSSDLAFGGQGAPLAPLVDQYLFEEYPICLNLGGIANVSVHFNEAYIAFDTGPANQVLNALAQKAGKAFDENGQLASSGRVIPSLLRKVDAQDYFYQPPPKSLSNQQVQLWTQMYLHFQASVPNLLATACEQTAKQIAKQLRPFISNLQGRNTIQMLVTGGGALNPFLMQRIRAHCLPLGIQVVLPERTVIEYKEALLMALLGLLRIERKANSLASVTGASQDSLGGALYEPLS